jgi:hypothetical protein
MNKKYKFLFIVLLYLPILLFFVVPSVLAVECKTGFTPEAGVCFPTDTGLSEKPVYDIIKNLMYWILGIFGLLAIIAFVISGIQYLTSSGEEKSVETAKRNMKWAVVGVVVALSGYVIVKAVDAALKASSTTF